MKTSAVRHQAIAVLTLTIVASPALGQSAHQQEPSPEVTPPVVITPYVSLGSSSSSRVGAAIRFALTPKLSVEAETGYRRAEIGALSTHVSLLYTLPPFGRLKSYVAGGVGVEEYGRAVDIPQRGLVAQERLAFVVNTGAGLEVPVTARWGLRSDARWFNGLGRFAPEHWRLFNGVSILPGAR